MSKLHLSARALLFLSVIFNVAAYSGASAAQSEEPGGLSAAETSGNLPTETAEIEQRISALYDNPFANDPLNPDLPLAPELDRLFTAERDAVRGEDGGSGVLSGNWLVDGQDAEITELAISTRPADPGEMIVLAAFRNFGEQKTVMYLWRQQDDAWLLADIYVAGAEQSIVEMLTAAYPQ